MLEHLAQQIVTFFVDKGVIPQDEQEVYAYSLEVCLASGIFWLAMITLAVVFDELGSTFWYLGWFFLFRRVAGGCHARDHLRCTSLSLIIYLGFLLLIRSLPSGLILPTALLLTLITVYGIWRYAPRDHVNRPFSDEERQRFRNKSRQLLGIFLIFIAVVAICDWRLTVLCSACGAAQAAASVIVAYYLERREQTYGNDLV